mmetsp:Transcript_18673/g.43680  ORF Transcript_18673/g.43680 Transcript_18673/m.43680 type:complete len:155 (+) Transcript_18673:62-526(+)
MAEALRRRGAATLLDEAKRIDAKGLALLEELLAAFAKRDIPGISEVERHRVAAEEVEPVLELLQEVTTSSATFSAALHEAARKAAEGQGCLQVEEVKAFFTAADMAEQDAQLKAQLVASLSQTSEQDQVTAVQIMWSTQPWLDHGVLGRRDAEA